MSLLHGLAAALCFSYAALSSADPPSACEVTVDDGLSLLQRETHRLQRKAQSRLKSDPGACIPLNNLESVLSAEVGVGTPMQTLHAIVDTGSTGLVVESCLCKDSGNCWAGTSCFDPANSRSFQFKDGEKRANFTYGSGRLVVEDAEDWIHMGELGAMDEIFLMVNCTLYNNLQNPEGLLGIGLYDNDRRVGSFMQAAHVNHFSMEFIGNGEKGALHVNAPLDGQLLGTIARPFWALFLHSFSAGVSLEHADDWSLCVPENGKPCIAIVDSGTSSIMAPNQEAWAKLLAALCDKWGRCRDTDLDNPYQKAAHFTDLMAHCESWITSDADIEEVPPVNFRLKGADGEVQDISLSVWSYMIKVHEMNHFWCELTFGFLNGYGYLQHPTWILGSAVFIEYAVGFDHRSSPPSLSFNAHLGGCSHDTELPASTKDWPCRVRHRDGPRRIRQLDLSEHA